MEVLDDCDLREDGAGEVFVDGDDLALRSETWSSSDDSVLIRFLLRTIGLGDGSSERSSSSSSDSDSSDSGASSGSFSKYSSRFFVRLKGE